MSTPPPIAQEEIDELALRIHAAGGEGRSEMIEAAAGGDLALAEMIDQWLTAHEGGEGDLHEQGTIVGDEGEDQGFRADLIRPVWVSRWRRPWWFMRGAAQELKKNKMRDSSPREIGKCLIRHFPVVS